MSNFLSFPVKAVSSFPFQTDDHQAFSSTGESRFLDILAGPIRPKFESMANRCESAGVGLYISERQNRVSREVYVEYVTPGSPAEESGAIVAGDVIISVDDRDVAAEEINTIRRMLLGQHGSFVKLVVKRSLEISPLETARASSEIENRSVSLERRVPESLAGVDREPPSVWNRNPPPSRAALQDLRSTTTIQLIENLNLRDATLRQRDLEIRNLKLKLEEVQGQLTVAVHDLSLSRTRISDLERQLAISAAELDSLAALKIHPERRSLGEWDIFPDTGVYLSLAAVALPRISRACAPLSENSAELKLILDATNGLVRRCAEMYPQSPMDMLGLCISPTPSVSRGACLSLALSLTDPAVLHSSDFIPMYVERMGVVLSAGDRLAVEFACVGLATLAMVPQTLRLLSTNICVGGLLTAFYSADFLSVRHAALALSCVVSEEEGRRNILNQQPRIHLRIISLIESGDTLTRRWSVGILNGLCLDPKIALSIRNDRQIIDAVSRLSSAADPETRIFSEATLKKLK